MSSSDNIRGTIGVRFYPTEAKVEAASVVRIYDLTVSGATVESGRRLTIACRPDPMPANPFDDQAFVLSLQVTKPDGGSIEVAGFYRQPMRFEQHADGEVAIPDGIGRFECRYRPCMPGVYQMRLIARWNDGKHLVCPMPEVRVTGKQCDPFVRVDAADRRYLSVNGAFFWPFGVNLHNPYDMRSAELLGTRPDHRAGLQTYMRLIDTLAAHGLNAAEMWMSSWNFALEWRSGWSGFDGIGWYNQANAERLDRILERAEERGVRVVLALHNHGQLSMQGDSEWTHNPWNKRLGGPCEEPRDVLHVADGNYRQRSLHRYIMARWSDSPAILSWKTWTEFDLTAASDTERGDWQAVAVPAIQSMDVYDHPISIHASADYRYLPHLLASDPHVGMLCVNAYTLSHRSGLQPGYPCTLEGLRGLLCAGLYNSDGLWNSVVKPVLITEFGGSWDAGPEPILDAMLVGGPAMAATMGYAGAPLFWWWEWVDQRDRWSDLGRVAGMLTNVDLRRGLVAFNGAKEVADGALPASCVVADGVAFVTVGPVGFGSNRKTSSAVGGSVDKLLSAHAWRVVSNLDDRGMSVEVEASRVSVRGIGPFASRVAFAKLQTIQ